MDLVPFAAALSGSISALPAGRQMVGGARLRLGRGRNRSAQPPQPVEVPHIERAGANQRILPTANSGKMGSRFWRTPDRLVLLTSACGFAPD